MLVVVSPAKKLNWEARDMAMTQPAFQKHASALADIARELSQDDLKKLMKLSDNLARLNKERFEAFQADPDQSRTRPAVLAFAGDTYQGLEAATLDSDELAWAQDHLRILSGLYGVLRPLDAMQAYRLEMGSRLKTPRGKSLYDYWGDQIAKALNDAAAQVNSTVLVNCASQEYFGAVDTKALNLKVITPVFMEDKGTGPKIVSFYAKKARGAMARYMIGNHLTDPAALLEFDAGGYAYQPDLSTENKPVFLRPSP